MKNPILLTSLTVAVLSVSLIACSKSTSEKVSDKASHAYETSKTAVVDTWHDVKAYSFEKSDDFKQRAEAISSDLDAKISKLKTEASEAKASASRSAVMDELKNSRADLSAKLAALGTATADTWESAKSNVITAAKRVEAAYDKARADAS